MTIFLNITLPLPAKHAMSGGRPLRRLTPPPPLLELGGWNLPGNSEIWCSRRGIPGPGKVWQDVEIGSFAASGLGEEPDIAALHPSRPWEWGWEYSIEIIIIIMEGFIRNRIELLELYVTNSKQTTYLVPF